MNEGVGLPGLGSPTTEDYGKGAPDAIGRPAFGPDREPGLGEGIEGFDETLPYFTGYLRDRLDPGEVDSAADLIPHALEASIRRSLETDEPWEATDSLGFADKLIKGLRGEDFFHEGTRQVVHFALRTGAQAHNESRGED